MSGPLLTAAAIARFLDEHIAGTAAIAGVALVYAKAASSRRGGMTGGGGTTTTGERSGGSG